MRSIRFAALAAVLAVHGAPATLQNDALVYTTTIAPATLGAGDSVTVTVVVTNESPYPTKMSSVACPHAFIVSTMSGKDFKPAARICSLVMAIVTLGRDQQYEFTESWHGNVLGGMLAPGKYLVRGYPDKAGPHNPAATIEITE